MKRSAFLPVSCSPLTRSAAPARQTSTRTLPTNQQLGWPLVSASCRGPATPPERWLPACMGPELQTRETAGGSEEVDPRHRPPWPTPPRMPAFKVCLQSDQEIAPSPATSKTFAGRQPGRSLFHRPTPGHSHKFHPCGKRHGTTNTTFGRCERIRGGRSLGPRHTFVPNRRPMAEMRCLPGTIHGRPAGEKDGRVNGWSREGARR